MHVREAHLVNFTSYTGEAFVLPERGIVMVTGPNGAGKSSLIESVAWAGWGKTLRGTTPWSSLPCGVSLSVTGLDITRNRNEKDKTELEWAPNDQYGESELSRAVDTLVRLGAIGSEFETPTKAQEALEKIIGPFDVWRRCNVFSSQDGAHFTLASDGERKRLIESFLGSDIFDEALERCRNDVKAEINQAGVLRADLGRVSATLANAIQQRETTEHAQSLLGDAPALVQHDQKEAARHEALGKKIGIELRKKEDEVRALEQRAGALTAEAKRIDQLLARLSGHAECYACHQPVDDALKERLRSEADTARVSAAETAKADEGERSQLQDEIDELREEGNSIVQRSSSLRDSAQQAQRSKQDYERWEKQAKHCADTLASCELTIHDSEQEIAALTPKLSASMCRLFELQLTERVLGLRGVRAPLLADSLAGIEGVANAWLVRLGRVGLQVKLLPYSEKKSGGVVDAISLEVVGAGGGYGYKASSGGERRRIDVALMLALAEVASAAHGHLQGTMFFDEVFDQLDVEGMDSLAEALGELAADRCVVVITHSETLVDRVPWARRITVNNGAIDVRTA